MNVMPFGFTSAPAQLLLLLLLTALLVDGAHALYFEDGYDHHYTYSSESDMLGMHNITTVIKVRIRSVNTTMGGDGGIHQLLLDSFVQYSELGYIADNPMKWDLTRGFYFIVGVDGVVTFVHHHPDEEYEVLSLKKVLTSTLSTNVKGHPGDKWKFTSKELDHAGHLEHEYEGERTANGAKIVRRHNSTDKVHRQHDKTLLLNADGTPLHVQCHDNVTMQSRKPTKQRQPMEGETEIHDHTSGEFPTISSVSYSTMELTLKRPHVERRVHDIAEMEQDTVLVHEKATVTTPLDEVRQEIQQRLDCVHSYANKFERNRTACVTELSKVLSDLHKNDFVQLGRQILTQDCQGNTTSRCTDERDLFLDLLARDGSAETQRFIAEFVLGNPNAREADLQRSLLHCVTLTEPVPELILEVERLCFNGSGNMEANLTAGLSKTQRRACLAQGSLARALHTTNVTESDRLVQRLEDWLAHHNQTEAMHIIQPRKKRSILEHDVPAKKHIHTKMVLISSLGNAGRQRSLGHILSYMEPNMGVSSWRRTAINSLRHFTCNQSATALITSAAHDDDGLIRQVARGVLEKHPLKYKPSMEQETIILSKRYTYPVVARVRRSIMDTLEKGIEVHIEPPGIEWEKQVGSSKLGASFGLHMRNILDLKLELLSGHFLVDIYDGAYATAHCGLVGLEVDVFKVLVCYRGHAEYNMNVLKDFGINSLQDLTNIFDTLTNSIVSPIKEAIDSFNNVLTAFKGLSLKHIINTLKEAVHNLPHILGDAIKRVGEFAKEVFEIEGSSELEAIKLIVLDLFNSLNAVRRDIILFFNEIVDLVTVQLPFIGKKIIDAFNVIKNSFKTLLKNPMQSVFGMIRGVSQIKMALTMAVEVKNKLTAACEFDKGRYREWMNAIKEIPRFFGRFRDAFAKLATSLQTRRRAIENMYNNGVQTMGQAVRGLESDLMNKWEEVLAPLQPLIDITKPFMDGYQAITDIITSVKSAYKNIKKVIEMGKSLVQKVFGPKFHLKFPTRRRDKDPACPTGVWPTTTGDVYATSGVDLLVNQGLKVYAPVDCIVHVESDTKVVLQPTGQEFQDLQIVIENIHTIPYMDGTFVPAGNVTGRASKAPKCAQNFIHVSVRQVPETELKDDADYEYVDPSSYLDRLVPEPKWIQECNDYEFKYIGSVADLAEMVEDAIEEAKKEIERKVNAAIDGLMEDIMNDLDLDTDFDESSFFEAPNFNEKMDNDFSLSVKAYGDRFKTALYGENGLFEMLNIFEIIDLNKKDVEWVLDRLDKEKPLYTNFLNTIKDLDAARTAVPVGNPILLGLPYTRRILTASGVTGDPGDITDMAAALTLAAETKCPLFKDKIAAGGHVCTAHNDCMGITCDIALDVDGRWNYVKIDAVVNPSGFIAFSINSVAFELDPDDTEHTINVGVKLGKLALKLLVETTVRNEHLSLSFEVVLCHESTSSCLKPVEIINDIEFPLKAIVVNGPITGGGEAEIQRFTLQNLINDLGEYDLLNREIINTVNEVRMVVLNELLAEQEERVEELIQEFKEILDFCESGDIPVDPIHIKFMPTVTYRFMVGPIPMSFSFGAGGVVGFSVEIGFCIMSMKSNVTLTPWITGYAWGALAIDIGFAYGGIRLTGYLLETRFPISVEVVFAKFPIDIGSKMDMVLTPLHLVLSAFAKINLLFKTITVFNANIWEYKLPSITKNIFDKLKRDDDDSAPELADNKVSARRKRTGDNKGCIVQQIAGRSPDDTAFSLEVHAEDAVSDVKLFYAIGTYRGGTNVVDWTDMGGSTLLVPAKLPGGIPLYWTVKAENSQGLSTTTQCFLETFDSTVPDGRVEHSYKFSSHPSKVSASVIVFEDSLLEKTHHVSLGYSPGRFGSEFVGWQPFELGHSKDRDGVTGILSRFAVPREGKLIVFILKSMIVRTPDLCAQACVNFGLNCVSFDYERHSETCDLHAVVQGPSAVLAISGTYSNYERLGVGYNTLVEYVDLPLTHGTTFFINAQVGNVLAYVAYLVGDGTMVDFTPPQPGPILNNASDVLRADGCNAAVTQRCVDVTWEDNHRIIVDGPGSGTVFNGLEALYDAVYTLANHYLSANWYGFHDDESGIWGYTWAVGTRVCGVDILPYNDPYVHLSSKKFWTDSGFHKGLHLDDGAYYVTVQALNGAELGGSLVTTVCHSVPVVVDTSAPLFLGVTDIIYDEDFDLIAIYYDANDDLSKIALAEFGLGKTKYDVQLKAYSLHASMQRDDPFLSLEELGLKEGIPAWIRVRVTNHVGLFTTGHGKEPILIDRSPPGAGDVLDGSVFQRDLTYQADSTRICAQWRYFHDPQSGIDRYTWSVGTTPGNDDVVPVQSMTHYEKSGCATVDLQHDHTYYSTVYAYNNALNSKGNHSVSNGVLVDITPPLPGHVTDGKVGEPDLNFTSETVSKHCHWRDYSDPESGIVDRYRVDVIVNTERKATFDVGKDETFDDHTVSLEHKDNVYFVVHGVNGAELEVAAASEGFLVDHTSPIMTTLFDHENDSPYQSENNLMRLGWNYYDSESGIREYRTIIYEYSFGIKQIFWPITADYNITVPTSPYLGEMNTVVDGLVLADGATYSLHVTAVNRAMISTSHETPGVTIDSTPPDQPYVHIGLLDEEEEEDESGNILHNDQNGIRVSWRGRDPQSGIKRYLVAVGIKDSQTYLTGFLDYSEATTTYIQHVHFELGAESDILYIVYVKAINGAGLESVVGESAPIYIVKANVPGIVFDGRTLFEDAMFSKDHTSIAASFYGFASESCNITGYDWGIGIEEYGTDFLSFTNYGLVMHNATHGFAQINTELSQDTTYYVTIRAITGCHGEYIVSSSDGLTIDSSPPHIYYSVKPDIRVAASDGVIYQAESDVLAIMSNVSDTQHIPDVQRALGTLPFEEDIYPFTSDVQPFTSGVQLVPGNAVFMTTYASDVAGNDNTSYSAAVITDLTPPVIHGFACVPYISIRKSVVVCDWSMLEEMESTVNNITFAVGTRPLLGDIIAQYLVPHGSRQFKLDVISTLKTLPSITEIYVDVSVRNIIGRRNDYEAKVGVDITPPTATSLTVVTRTSDVVPDSHQPCQVASTYMELSLNGLIDDESGIDPERFEVCVGSERFGSDLLPFNAVSKDTNGLFFVNGFHLTTGSVFYATIRAYNKAGLSVDTTSERVVVSLNPYLRVYDGDGADDIDFQSHPNIIQGHWAYSDECPINRVHWQIRDILDTIVVDFTEVLDTSSEFYNDAVKLDNGIKYMSVIRIVDAINRTRIAMSDGFTIRIQPPSPGFVRDGVDEDINYQFSTTELSANWDEFGDSSGDPTQRIEHYEIAVGNDRRYENTRTNVHYFVNVGLNTSYTFDNLNLTTKLVKYYVTVRAVSISSGYTDGYSNGIRVGFNDVILHGNIIANEFQSSTDTISFSWNGFYSDIGIQHYIVAVSSHVNFVTNDTFDCKIIENNASMFDVSPMSNNGLDEYIKIQQLHLRHNQSYYPTVIAADAAGMCTAVTGTAISVDISPPLTGDLFINGITKSNIIFADSESQLTASWQGFDDHESGIQLVIVNVFQCPYCTNMSGPLSRCISIAEAAVQGDTTVTFYELELSTVYAYVTRIVVNNGASLATIQYSPSILLDTTNPLAGTVKITDNWEVASEFQSSTTSMHGLVALATTSAAYNCAQEKIYFPSDISEWETMGNGFRPEFQIVNQSGAYLGIGYNADLSDIIRTGIVGKQQLPLRTGDYPFHIQAGKGANIVTTVALITDSNVIPFSIDEKPIETVFDWGEFDNVPGLTASENGTSNNTTTNDDVTKPPPNDNVSNITVDAVTYTSLQDTDFGIGIHLLGYKIQNNTAWHHVFWARSKSATIQQWFRMEGDPTASNNVYTIKVNQPRLGLDMYLDLSLLVNDNEVVTITGFRFQNAFKFAMLTWNEENYKPPIDDIYQPFYTDAIVSRIYIPQDRDMPCQDGRGFYDGESGVKEVWAGVSNSDAEVGNVSPLELVYRFCYSCQTDCEAICMEPCSYDNLTNEYEILPLSITGLNLKTITIEDECLNISSGIACNRNYYLNVKVVNFAGQSTVVHSNAIQVDSTPPRCQYVECLDPEYSPDAPTRYLGSSSTIGAFWNCTEDVGQIHHYTVSVTNADNDIILMNSTDVGTQSKVRFTIGKGTFRDGKMYRVHVTAVNTAGQATTSACVVHVHLYPPRVAGSSSIPMYVTGTPDDQAAKTDSQGTIGIRWTGGDSDTEFYEWQVGTQPGSRDVFPPIMVGVNSSGSVAIIEGNLHLEDQSVNKALSEFRPTDNITSGEWDEREEEADSESSFFSMEPGRCVYQTLYAIGYSHLKSKVGTRTVCVKRSGAAQIDPHDGSRVVSKPKDATAWQSGSTTDPEITVDIGDFDGEIQAGSLTSEDKMKGYGSAASHEFVPYISDPQLTRSQTSRMLRNRIVKFCDISFYVSPTPVAVFETVYINITVPAGCHKDAETQPALIYWDVRSREWTHNDEGCNVYLTATMSDNIYSAQLCIPTEASSNVSKRSTVQTMTSPRHMEVVQIYQALPNHAPSITHTLIRTVEDNFTEVEVETYDQESDKLLYEIITQPNHADCFITEGGFLNCIPEENYYGDDEIEIKITEFDLPTYLDPLTDMKMIPIQVSDAPDITERVYVDPDGWIHSEIRPQLSHTLVAEANRTSIVFAGTIILTDMDGGEEFTPIASIAGIDHTSYTLTEVAMSSIYSHDTLPTVYNTFKAYYVEIQFSPTTHGEINFRFIAQTRDMLYTPSVSIDMYLQLNPCVYGTCSHATRPSGCEDIERAESFADYECVCRPGYVGSWCEVDVNECAPAPCSTLFDCADLENAYSCTINMPKLMAVILCSIVAAVGAVLLTYFLLRRWKNNKMEHKKLSLVESSEQSEVGTAESQLSLFNLESPDDPAVATGRPKLRWPMAETDVDVDPDDNRSPPPVFNIPSHPPPHHTRVIPTNQTARQMKRDIGRANSTNPNTVRPPKETGASSMMYLPTKYPAPTSMRQSNGSAAPSMKQPFTETTESFNEHPFTDTVMPSNKHPSSPTAAPTMKIDVLPERCGTSLSIGSVASNRSETVSLAGVKMREMTITDIDV